MRSAPRGFTLVETIFATLFIGLTVLGIVNLFPGAYLSIRKSETTIQADNRAKSVLDELRLTPFEELVEGEYTKEKEKGERFGPVTVEGVLYTVDEILIYEVPDASFDSLKGVKVTITYRLGFSYKNVVYETYLHQWIR